jgi:hypothetical protein
LLFEVVVSVEMTTESETPLLSAMLVIDDEDKNFESAVV